MSYNYFMIIGRICKDFEIREVGEGKKVVNLFIAVNRDFKNMEGNYDTDFFNVSLWEYTAEQAIECLKKGSLVGIKGRLAPREILSSNESKIRVTELWGERICFFSNPNSKPEEDNTEIEGL